MSKRLAPKTSLSSKSAIVQRGVACRAGSVARIRPWNNVTWYSNRCDTARRTRGGTGLVKSRRKARVAGAIVSNEPHPMPHRLSRWREPPDDYEVRYNGQTVGSIHRMRSTGRGLWRWTQSGWGGSHGPRRAGRSPRRGQGGVPGGVEFMGKVEITSLRFGQHFHKILGRCLRLQAWAASEPRQALAVDTAGAL
jgi:hypothetical protein